MARKATFLSPIIKDMSAAAVNVQRTLLYAAATQQRSPLALVHASLSAATLQRRHYRTATCGEMRLQHEGRAVDLSGWVHAVRVMGDNLVFISLRDAYGITQVVVEAGAEGDREAWQSRMLTVARELKQEAVVQVTGMVRKRPEELVNAGMATGTVEVLASGLRVLSSPSGPLPIVPGALSAHKGHTSEDVRLAARFIDLRRDVMQRNLRLRSLVAHSIRTYLLTQCSPAFVEVETPYLVRSSPEGAREFLVPTRHKSKWYALAQSPQQWKQMLMMGGMDRYFQIARCFRDETGRADRQPEFTQVDLELSFASALDVQEVVEGMVGHALQAAGRAAKGESHAGLPVYDFNHYHPALQAWQAPSFPLARLSYVHCLTVYGSDKPDRRIGMPLWDVSGQVKGWDARHPAVKELQACITALQAAASSSASSHPRLHANVWQADPADSDLSLLSQDVWAVRVCVAKGLGAALTRSEGEAVSKELSQSMPAGCGVILARVTAPAPAPTPANPARSASQGEQQQPMFKDSILAKGLSKEQQAQLIQSVGASNGDLFVLTWGAGTVAAQAAGTCRLGLADTMRLCGLGHALAPHGTHVRLGQGDILNHALGSALAAALPARKPSSSMSGHGKSKAGATTAPAAGAAGGAVPPPAPAHAGAPVHGTGHASTELDLFWVTGFPMFEQGSDGALAAVHHPFTAPVPEDAPALMTAATKDALDIPVLLGLRGQAYDLVANGVELGGGSVRMHEVDVQRTVLEKVLRLTPAENHGFGALLAALGSGAPPHAGLALGLDRWVAMLAGPAAATSVRDVIAFPKSAAGADLITGAPAEPTPAQLQEYHVKLA